MFFFFFFLSLFLFDLLLRPPTESRFSCQPIVCVCVCVEKKKGENAVLDSDKDGASSQVKGLVIVSNRNGSSEFILLKL